jgi:hypothetical protein
LDDLLIGLFGDGYIVLQFIWESTDAVLEETRRDKRFTVNGQRDRAYPHHSSEILDDLLIGLLSDCVKRFTN